MTSLELNEFKAAQRKTGAAPVTLPKPAALPVAESVPEEKESKAFYIVTTVAGIAMVLLAITAVGSMVYFFATQCQ